MYGDIVVIVNGVVWEQVLQGVDDGGVLVFGVCVEQLQYEKVVKVVDSDVWQVIGFVGDQVVVVEVIVFGQSGMSGLCLLQMVFKEGVIDGFIVVEGLYVGVDL